MLLMTLLARSMLFLGCDGSNSAESAILAGTFFSGGISGCHSVTTGMGVPVHESQLTVFTGRFLVVQHSTAFSPC